jgi:hypothetical protein
MRFLDLFTAALRGEGLLFLKVQELWKREIDQAIEVVKRRVSDSKEENP